MSSTLCGILADFVKFRAKLGDFLTEMKDYGSVGEVCL